MSEVFTCRMCGECCRNMRGRTAQQSLPRLPPFVFVAVPPSMQTMSIQEWEIPALNAHAMKFSIELHIKPSMIIWDEIGRTPIATHWILDHNDCPFLTRQNACAIHENKPLNCQAYPLFFFGIFTGESKEPKELGVGDCPVVPEPPFAKGVPMKIGGYVLFRELYRIYGTSFLGMLRLDRVADIWGELLRHLVAEEVIRPAIIDHKVRKAVLRSKPVGLLEFLRREDPEQEKSVRRAVAEIYDLDMNRLGRSIEHRSGAPDTYKNGR